MKFQEMEEKLRLEKEEEKKEADAKRDQGPDLDSEHDEKDENNLEDNQNDVEVEVEAVPNETVENPTAVENESAGDNVIYTPGPIRVPTEEHLSTNSIAVSELPPVPQTVVEQERLEMIEINNDGTSGHLTHSLD